MKVRALAPLVPLAAALVAANADATIITFDFNPALSTSTPIPAAYGDRVNASSDAVGSYGLGNGWTPNVLVSYRTLNSNDTLYESHVKFWNTGYGNLTNVAYPSITGKWAEITLTPDAGYTLTIDSFDLGAYYNPVALSGLSILESGSSVWSSGLTSIVGGATHSAFAPAISSASALTIRWGTDWNVGIDNLSFHQSGGAVPVPATALLLATGLVGAGIARRRGRPGGKGCSRVEA
jgi:hypothetical protein